MKILKTNETCLTKVSVYDGDSARAPLKTEICTQSHPPPIYSNGNSLTITLSNVLPFTVPAIDRFEAQYSVIDNGSLILVFAFKNIVSFDLSCLFLIWKACGGEFRSKSGYIATPSYPNSYPININCVWNLKSSVGNRLVLTIETFDVDESEKCSEDYLEIRENSENGKLLGVFCGKAIPSDIPTAQNYWLFFSSSNDGVGKGFLAKYTYGNKLVHTVYIQLD